MNNLYLKEKTTIKYLQWNIYKTYIDGDMMTLDDLKIEYDILQLEYGTKE